MKRPPQSRRVRGFTLVELLVALLILSLLSLMAYRGLGAVLDARAHVHEESGKWRRMAAFFARFGQDVQLAAPRPVRTASGSAPPWMGVIGTTGAPHLEFSRFAATESLDAAQRLAYRLNEKQEIELWLWPALDAAPDAEPARYPLLGGVAKLEIGYLGADLAWVDHWPGQRAAPLPRAVRVRLVLNTGEDVVRIFALPS